MRHTRTAADLNGTLSAHAFECEREFNKAFPICAGGPAGSYSAGLDPPLQHTRTVKRMDRTVSLPNIFDGFR